MDASGELAGELAAISARADRRTGRPRLALDQRALCSGIPSQRIKSQAARSRSGDVLKIARLELSSAVNAGSSVSCGMFAIPHWNLDPALPTAAATASRSCED